MFICLTVKAQTDKGLIRLGNKEFKNGNYSEKEKKEAFATKLLFLRI